MKPFERWTLWLQAVTFAVAVLVAFIYYEQLVVMSRARIGITGNIAMKPVPLAANVPVWVEVDFVNSGPTSANSLEANISWAVLPEFPDNPPQDQIIRGESLAVAEPHVVMQSVGPVPAISEKALKAINDDPPELKFFIYGTYRYDDGMHWWRRTTRFCFFYLPDRGSGAPQWIACDRYAYSD